MSSADEFYDVLETLDPASREEQVLAQVSAQFAPDPATLASHVVIF